MTTIRGLIVADDLTGANDTGHQLATRGYETTVVMDDEMVVDATDVLVCNTDSRYCSAEVAADRVAAVVEAHSAPVVYKKVDSTLRGNLAAEITATVKATDSDLAIVAPAFPETDRITVRGMHLADGSPVAETAAGQDPDKPVTDSHIPTLLAALEYRLEQVELPTIDHGVEAVERRLTSLKRQDEPVVVVCDAVRTGHLETIATAAARLDGQVTYVGSGGLARHVRLDVTEDGGVLGVVGSASPQTFTQLSAIDEDLLVEIDTELAIRDPEASARDATSEVVDTIRAHQLAVLTAARSASDVEATIETGASAGLTKPEIRDRIAVTLGDVSAAVYGERRITGMFATGGAVATQLLDELGGAGVRLTGQTVVSGVPVSRIVGGAAAGTPLVTKAGAFGGERTIYKSLMYLSRYDGQ